VQVLLKEGAVQCVVIIDLGEMERLLFRAGAAERRRGAVCGHHRFGRNGTVIVFVQVLLKEGAVQCAVIIDLVEKEQLLFCAGAAERRRGAACGHYRLGRAPRRRNCCVLEGVGVSEKKVAWI